MMELFMTQVTTDVLVLGGTTGGVAAALALGRLGVRCVVAEESDWIGGQLTAQAVPPDENRWIETYGGTATYAEFRERVREWYREHRPLTPAAASDPWLNPGGGWVSRLCFEPWIGHAVLTRMLEPYTSAAAAGAGAPVTIMLGVRAASAELHDASKDSLRAVTLWDEAKQEHVVVRAKYFLDATDLGDLYPLAEIEHAIGAEHTSVYGEMHARSDKTDELDQQAFSWCFAVEHRPGEEFTIPKPEAYDFWRAYVPKMEPAWPGPLFSWRIPTHNKEGVRELPMIPWPDEPRGGSWELWRYRRILDAAMYTRDAARTSKGAGEFGRDVCLVNWVQMDYWLKPLLNVSEDARRTAQREAREQSLCLLYWMQTEAPRHDSAEKVGYPGLRLAGETLGTSDGFAKMPYIREPRRLLAREMLTEAHVGSAQRRAEGKPNMDVPPYGSGEPFANSIGIGHYWIDLHPSCSGRNSVYVPSCPWRMPLGSLIPKRVRNVIAAGKAFGVSHIANAGTRMHPTEWNVGESAGVLAALCLRLDKEPAAILESDDLTSELQRELKTQGVRMTWPWEK
jgi:hypothetical protein